MTSVGDVLLSWDGEIAELVTEVRARPRITDRPSHLLMQRRSYDVRMLRRTFLSVAAAKERVLWSVLRREIDDGADIVAQHMLVKRAVEELMLEMRWLDDRNEWLDHEIDRMLEKLEDALELDRALISQVESHVTGPANEQLVHRLVRARRIAPVLPHPDTPPGAIAAAVIKPVFGVLDRIRDAVSTTPA